MTTEEWLDELLTPDQHSGATYSTLSPFPRHKWSLPCKVPPLARRGDTGGTAQWSGCGTHSRHSWSLLPWLSTSETPATEGLFGLDAHLLEACMLVPGQCLEGLSSVWEQDATVMLGSAWTVLANEHSGGAAAPGTCRSSASHCHSYLPTSNDTQNHLLLTPCQGYSRFFSPMQSSFDSF